jgi:pimeloyl-ACP methyl ester carboxylesterase
MRWWRSAYPGLVLLAGLLFLDPRAGRAQAKDKDDNAVPVDFTTVDRVLLKGAFYPSARGKLAPTVLLLHAFGEDSNKTEWLNLAAALQQKGYAVLRFDFRGHGNSTSVEPGVARMVPGFWDQKENQQGYKKFNTATARKTTTIDYKDFTLNYHRILINDIAAAKEFLDEKNDAGECNTSNLILIGAKEGATLGAGWLNSEWHRFRVIGELPRIVTVNTLNQVKLDLVNPEGANVTAAVWLSMTDKFSDKTGNVGVNPAAALVKAGTVGKTPMVFFYGDRDEKGKVVAEACVKAIKGTDKKTYPLTYAVKVPGAEKLAGSHLLGKGVNLGGTVIEYLEQAQKGKSPKHKTHQDKMDIYVWRYYYSATQQRTVVARSRGEVLPIFGSYQSFLRTGSATGSAPY